MQKKRPDRLKCMLRAARASKGYTQTALAKTLKCSQSCISSWESGNLDTASFGDIVRMCQLLNIDITELAKEV